MGAPPHQARLTLLLLLSLRRLARAIHLRLQQQHRRVTNSVLTSAAQVSRSPRYGGAYGSLTSCGVLPVMSRDVYLVSIDDGIGGSGRTVTATKVATTGAQPMARVYASLVLMTSGERLQR